MSSDFEFSDEDQEDYDDMDEDEDNDDLIDQDDDSDMSEDDMDMDGGADERVSPAKGKAYEVEFDSLPQHAIESLIRKDVEHISSIFGVPNDAASLLLRHMDWNKEKLIEKYMDTPAELNVKAGIALAPPPVPVASSSSTRPSGSRAKSIVAAVANKRTTRRSAAESAARYKAGESSSSSPILEQQPPTPVICQICFDDEQTQMSALACGHNYCSDCWATYMRGKIREEGEINIGCMSPECNLLVTDSFVSEVLGDDAVSILRYQELIVRHFVGYNKNFKFCPYPGCTFTVSCPSAVSKSALLQMVPTVHCGASEDHRFCFGCNIDGDHRPVICGVAKLWVKKCQDDSETANWIKSNTKECSQCQSTIEKNGGCNHMVCKKCKHNFCWVCLGPWTEHGTSWYNCNRFDESSGVDARDAQTKSRASLERYLHYYNRWANHEQSAKLSTDFYAKTEKKMEEMQITSNLTWIEVQFAKKALDELMKCRMTLKWTYAMAYYLARGNQKQLFEDNQSDLERAVEELSELLESPLDPENIATLRQKMTDKTVYVRKRNEILLEDTAVGFLEGRWEWDTDVEGFDRNAV